LSPSYSGFASPEKITLIQSQVTNGVSTNATNIVLVHGAWADGSVGINGRWVAFGGLTGADVKLNVQALYSKQIKLIGSTGGTRKELQELIDISSAMQLKVRVWKKFKLEDVKEALQSLFAKERDGRILLDISNIA
jgi:D-arabinose 1-dehydrogenase-like Zn-dependent alcohol dehydrogenase